MTTTAPIADSRAIALTHYAARGVLESVLSRHDATFQQSVTLRVIAVAEGPIERDAAVGQVVQSLKTDAARIQGTVEELVSKGLCATEGAALRLTDAGREFYDTVTAETAEISARIWADIPAEDLAAAGRVLAVVTERANAELAALRS
ncbi:MarR family winged helix-turn-helix transcriptional regulator [Streptomyces sp. NPDC057877]|uniref:MarR family winged helix-turn-helix transcriptional regulator n=1 Tax=Streptomyces sp. NPDC057877 TaxID=3346269 RepID=UPI0036AC7822